MRIHKKFPVQDLPLFRKKAMQWGSQNTHCCYLNGNSLPYFYDSFPEMLAVGCKKEYLSKKENFTHFLDDIDQEKDWAFGFLGYNAKEVNISNKETFPSGAFFSPVTLLRFTDKFVSVDSFSEPDLVFNEILTITLHENESLNSVFNPAVSKEEYMLTVNRLKENILRGNIYQINYCIRFEAENIRTDPFKIYQQLNNLSPMPFSGYLKICNFCLVSASPERFLKRTDRKIISQPMKGTAPAFEDITENDTSVQNFLKSEKEKAENVMITDLVRNDLTQISENGSVNVEKLCELYSFRHIHQMVSTVTGTLKDIKSSNILDHTFPMGSMTGAPKIRAMQLIEENESNERGPFSGTLGYFDPKCNFDLNVLIRSLFYDQASGKAFYAAGSGITHMSDAENEYKECMLKADTIRRIFTSSV